MEDNLTSTYIKQDECLELGDIRSSYLLVVRLLPSKLPTCNSFQRHDDHRGVEMIRKIGSEKIKMES